MDFYSLKPYFLIAACLLSSTNAQAFPANFNYTGPYMGINGGYFWGKSKSNTNTTFVPGSYFVQSDIPQINDKGSTSLDLNNATAGLQGGYNFQINRFMVGAEADFESLSASSAHSSTTEYLSAPGYSFTLYTKTRTHWLFTLRPRMGYVVNNALFYVTGGLAVTQLKTQNSFSDNFASGSTSSDASESANQSQNKAGWALGGGVEYGITDNITIKGEYLYTQFSNVTSNGQMNFNQAYLASFIPPLANSAPFNHSANFYDNILRVGINYKFF